jgi:hypothetical protein
MTTRNILIALGVAAALAAGVGTYSSTASAHDGPGYYGPRMMDGYGPRYGRGPGYGWRRGYGPGYRHMRGYGPGYARRGWRGEYCPGYGRGYGRWMMGW